MSKVPVIAVIGACNIDLISYVPRMPAIGETLHGTRFQMGFGGKGANQAVMAAKLGAAVTMVSKVGSDVFGENTLEEPRAVGSLYTACPRHRSSLFRCSADYGRYRRPQLDHYRHRRQ